jgi:hypothetical protein
MTEHPHPPFPPQQQPKPGIESEIHPRPQFEAPAYRAAGKLEALRHCRRRLRIGRAVAVLFAREGADDAIVYLPVEEPDAAETKSAVEAEGRRALLIPGDVQHSGFCAEAVERTLREFGRLVIVVNNAAYQQNQESIEDITDEQLDRT